MHAGPVHGLGAFHSIVFDAKTPTEKAAGVREKAHSGREKQACPARSPARVIESKGADTTQEDSCIAQHNAVVMRMEY